MGKYEYLLTPAHHFKKGAISMIYQLNHEFKTFKFKTVINNELHYLNDKEEFEEQFEELPSQLVYEDVILTEEQQERFESVVGIKDITLDEVVAYTVDGIEPTNPYYQIDKLKKDNEDLTIALAELLGGM